MSQTFHRLQEISNHYLEELIDSASGHTTSLPFIVHPLANKLLVVPGEQFQVLVIGGTVYKSALVTINDQRLSIDDQTSGSLPVFDTKEMFLSFVTSIIDKRISIVAVNFAYAMFPRFDANRLDGILVRGSKEHRFEGLIGEPVGQTIEDELQKRGQTIKIVTANDAICLLLSGLSKYQKTELAAGIVGSGLNFAIFLREKAAVNLESANFDKFSLSQEAKTIDAVSQKPGKALFEKETAGVYLYQLFNEKRKVRSDLPKLGPLRSTEELHDLAVNGDILAQELFTRSAQLISCQIAGITQFYHHDMVFVLEGSLFWKGWQYQKTVEETVKQLIPQYRVTYVHLENSGILGAAKLVA